MNDIQGTGETTASGRNIEALRIAFNLGLIKLSTLYAHQWVDSSMTFFFFFCMSDTELWFEVPGGKSREEHFIISFPSSSG